MAEEKEVAETEAELGKLKIDGDDNESVYIVGGYNGDDWLSTMDLYSPKKDAITSTKPMRLIRSHSSTVTLGGKMYVIAGGNGYQWYNSVESYDPQTDKWAKCPPLYTPKISLAACTVNDKIYALGGGNRFEWFAEVEMLDPGAGKWVFMAPMIDHRFALAAAEMNGVIYATGGYEGRQYLNTAERYDPRENSWKKIRDMGAERGCHSMVVMNDKLYVISGINDGHYSSSVFPDLEIYEPRKNVWLEGESLHFPRGFSVVVVHDNSIYCIGGMDRDEGIVDKIEVYKEGEGWKVIEPNAIGKRTFAAGVVM